MSKSEKEYISAINNRCSISGYPKSKCFCCAVVKTGDAYIADLQSRIKKLEASVDVQLMDITIKALGSAVDRSNKRKRALEDIIDIRNSFHKDKSIGKCTDMWKRAVKALKGK